MPNLVAGKRVTVVGAGAVGLSAAYFLQGEGAEVLLLDRAQPGDAASRGNAGWITLMLSSPLPSPAVRRTAVKAVGRRESPLFISPRLDPGLLRWLWQFWRYCNAEDYRAGMAALARLNRRTFDLFDALKHEGVDFPMWNRGLLVVFRDPAAADRELQEFQAFEAFGYRVPQALLEGQALRSLEPALAPDVRAGFLLPDERHIDPIEFTAGLARRIVERGGEIRTNFDVTGFSHRGRRVTAVRSATESLETDFLLIAAGASSGQLARLLGARLPIQGGKGYSFSFQSESPPSHPLYLGESKVGVTAFEGGRVRVAGTMEFSGLDLKLNPKRIRSIVSHAQNYLAERPQPPMNEPWVGMRPLTVDGLPAIGRDPNLENVYYSTGHSMLGVTLAPATAEALAESMSTGSTPPVLTPFSPARLISSLRHVRVA